MVLRETTLVLLAVSLLPGALASQSVSASGVFVTSGPVTLPPQASIELGPHALFVEDTTSVRLELHAPTAHIYLFEDKLIEGQVDELGAGRETSFTVRSWPLTNLRMSLREGQPTGWLGFYPRPDARLVGVAQETIDIQAAQPGAILGNSALDDHEQFDLYNYGRPLDGLLLANLAAETSIHGGGALKLEGGELVLDAQENRTSQSTGRTSRALGPTPHVRERIERWVVVEADELHVSLVTPQPFHLAFETAQASWDGTTTLQAERGHLTAAGMTYQAQGGLVSLDGQFESRLRAEAIGQTPAAVVLLDGTLRASSLVTAAQGNLPDAQGANLPSGGLFVLIGLGLVGGAAGLALVRRPRAHQAVPPSLSLEACLQEAQKAAEAGSFRLAAEWVAQARNHDPESAALWMRQARLLAKAGELHEALQAFRVAGNLSTDGQAELEAALLLGKHGGTAWEVEQLYDAHLRKSGRPTG